MPELTNNNDSHLNSSRVELAVDTSANEKEDSMTQSKKKPKKKKKKAKKALNDKDEEESK